MRHHTAFQHILVHHHGSHGPRHPGRCHRAIADTSGHRRSVYQPKYALLQRIPDHRASLTQLLIFFSDNGTATTSNNVQKFTGALGGPPPPVISSASGERPFSVNGDTFVGVAAAVGRSCDIQHNACANAANAGQLSGGVGQCDQQNTACHSANNLRKRLRLDVRAAAAAAATAPPLDLGSCSDASIVFGEGIDGRNTAAFVAANQGDFDHGSALNIAVIAGFICQRLDSPCDAPADTQAACALASAAAVAAPQDQTAADAWNAIMGGGGGGGGVAGSEATATATATATAAVMTPAPTLAVMPSPAVQLMTFSSCS